MLPQKLQIKLMIFHDLFVILQTATGNIKHGFEYKMCVVATNILNIIAESATCGKLLIAAIEQKIISSIKIILSASEKCNEDVQP